jgi:hypothetical protein
MQGYKNSDDASATEYLNDIKYIAFDALRIHYDCIASCTGAPPTAWATIPSTKSSPNYGKPNPLNAVIAQAMAPNGIPQLRLEATTTNTHNTINPRTFNLTNTSDEPPLNHVLLVEDSWVSGATVQSAAAMLHQIGAEHVTIYCLARIIDLRWTRRELGEQVSNGIMALRHETHRCPWTLQKHKP